MALTLSTSHKSNQSMVVMSIFNDTDDGGGGGVYKL